MSTDLFPNCQSILSPRIQWMHHHGIHCELNRGRRDRDCVECWEAFQGDLEVARDRAHEYAADYGEDPFHNRYLARGATEEEAISRLAIANGWKLWNQ